MAAQPTTPSSNKITLSGKELVVNGDDFGLSPEINAAILRAHTEGVLTSASLMVSASASEQAVAIAKQFPTLDVGLHLVLCDGTSCLPPERLYGLVDSAGRFANHEIPAGFRYLFHPRSRAALRDECRAQIETHLAKVGSLSHIDGHRNLHLHPQVIDILAELAPEYRVPYVRLVREPLSVTIRLARDRLAGKFIDAVFFRVLSIHARRRLARSGVKFADQIFGFLQTGRLDEAYVCSVLRSLRSGTVTEFYFHPTCPMANGCAHGPAERCETKILTSKKVADTIISERISLTNFAALAKARA